MSNKFYPIHLPNTTGIKLALNDDNKQLYYKLSSEYVPLNYNQIIKLPIGYLINDESLNSYLSENELKINTLLIDSNNKIGLFIAETSSIIELSQEYIETLEEALLPENKNKLMTVDAINNLIAQKLNTFNNDEIQTNFKTFLSDAYSQIIELPDSYTATSESIESFFEDSQYNTNLSKNILFIDSNKQIALYISGNIINISNEIIDDLSNVTSDNLDKLMTIGTTSSLIIDYLEKNTISTSGAIFDTPLKLTTGKAVKEFVENKLSEFTDGETTGLAGKLDIETFKAVSGNYIEADKTLSSALTGYVNDKVSSKLDKSEFESVSGNYIEADKTLSGALTGYVNDKVSGKLDKSEFEQISSEFVLTSQITNNFDITNNNIPTIKAVSTFVEDKINNIDKDYFITSASYDNTTSSIILQYNKDKDNLEIPVADLIDVYTAGNGLSENGHKFSIKLNNSEDNKFINLTSGGLGLSGITSTITNTVSEINYAQIVNLPDDYFATSASITDYLNNNNTIDKNTLFVDNDGQTALYFPASDNNPSSILDISQECIDNITDVTSDNLDKLMTVGAISAFVSNKLQNVDLTNYYTKNEVSDISSNITSAYQKADEDLSGLLTSYVDGLTYAQIINLPQGSIATSASIVTYLTSANIEISKNTLFVDNHGQTSLYFPAIGNNPSSILDISQEYIDNITDVTSANFDKLMTVSAISAFVMNKLENVDLTNYYTKNEVSDISGDITSAYQTSDEDLSGLLTSYVDRLFENTAKIIYTENPENIIDNTFYVNSDGVVSTQIDGSLKTLSLEVIDEIISNDPTNSDVIPTAEAVETFVENKLSGKQDKLTIANSIANNENIPTNSAVSAFVESK